jgi:2-polyprenyl-6-methoxyphenol hydroxylase-like FAD-dependent oxidoreductase
LAASLGKQAIVVGAGMGGLAAAAALSPHFGKVLVLDKDALPDGFTPRVGAGQSSHIHQLLRGGANSLERLLPGLEDAFYKAGAAKLRGGQDIEVRDFGGLLPSFDAGFSTPSLSRPAYERVLRARVAELPNVTIRTGASVRRCLVADGRCTGVETDDGETLAADLVVDASGMNAPLALQLAEDGHTEFVTEEVKINVTYVTGRFAKPAAWRGESKGFFFLPAPPDHHFGLLAPVENEEWVVSLGGRGANTPPRDLAGFRDYATHYATDDIFRRIRDAEPTADLKMFRKPCSTRRRYDQATRWPDRLLPLGDTMSTINPTYGQGMSVAALQAVELADQLAKRAAADAGLDGLAADFLPPAFAISDAAWSLSVNSDYVYPETEGERPANFPVARAVAATLRKLCDTDPEFLNFRTRLAHMLETNNGLREGPLAIKFFTALQGAMASPA